MSAARRLARAFLERHPRRAAERLGAAEPGDVAQVLDGCGDAVAAEVLQHVDPVQAGHVLDALSPERRAALLQALPPRRAALIVQDTDTGTAEAWLSALPPDLSGALRAALAYPADSAARLMDPAVLAAPVEMNAAQAKRLVARHAARALYYLYVIDAERRPVGVLNLRELMGASPKTPLAGLMHAPVVTVPVHAAAAVIATHPGWAMLHDLPVVDEQGQLVGVLRHETAERIRAQERERESEGGTGVGVALTEAVWALTAHLVDQVATAARPASAEGDAPDRESP